MVKVLIVYASRHGGTKGIALRIGNVLVEKGLQCTVAPAEENPDPTIEDACLLGSGVYLGSWLKEALDYGWRHAPRLAERPIWLFSSGPLPGPAADKATDRDDPLAVALGPKEGPGSGGRQKIAELSDALHPRDHRVFFGAYDPTQPRKSLPERLIRLTPASRSILPAGDYRDWGAIEGWAREIAAALVPAGVTTG